MYWFRTRRKRRSSVTKHYVEHKESARAAIAERLEYWNMHYGHTYNRVAIRNQKTCWGSCTEKGNLNFSYKLIFLPPHLMDYIIVHELCHLKELNHGKQFWELVGVALPEYKSHIRELRAIENFGTSVVYLQKVKENYSSQVVTSIPA
ncbi:MAG: putative metal-dependent hydrolase [Candidatus Azotimanducaceae bacterium]|jgi:predicted metal-dependent hydrolase